MSDHLEEALAMGQATIKAGLDEARAELEELRARQARVEGLIAKAEALLAEPDNQPAGEGRMTLHQALEQILREHGNRWVEVRELADEVNRRELYQKRDGSPVEPNQVHARTKNYDTIFEKRGSRVRLRAAPGNWDVVIFKDDDAGFFSWMDEHPNGYLINTERTPNPNYLVLHLAGCGHFDGAPTVHWTKDYIKICSGERGQLEGWAEQSVGGEVTLCRSCFG